MWIALDNEMIACVCAVLLFLVAMSVWNERAISEDRSAGVLVKELREHACTMVPRMFHASCMVLEWCVR